MTNPKIDGNGTKRWYNSDGKLHREDGPAFESKIEKSWFNNGEYHRDDGGAAVEYSGGAKYWYIKGKRITDEVEQWIKDNNLPDYKEWDDKTKILFKLTFG